MIYCDLDKFRKISHRTWIAGGTLSQGLLYFHQCPLIRWIYGAFWIHRLGQLLFTCSPSYSAVVSTMQKFCSWGLWYLLPIAPLIHFFSTHAWWHYQHMHSHGDKFMVATILVKDIVSETWYSNSPVDPREMEVLWGWKSHAMSSL